MNLFIYSIYLFSINVYIYLFTIHYNGVQHIQVHNQHAGVFTVPSMALSRDNKQLIESKIVSHSSKLHIYTHNSMGTFSYNMHAHM